MIRGRDRRTLASQCLDLDQHFGSITWLAWSDDAMFAEPELECC